MPPFGTGVLKTPITVCVRAMKKGMKKYLMKNKNYVKCKNIHIWVFGEDAFEEFQKEWQESIEEAKDEDSDSDEESFAKGKQKRNLKAFGDSDEEESKYQKKKGN